MKLTIKNPTPKYIFTGKWGDLYFGNSLKEALEREGINVVQDFWPNWGKEHGEDVVLVLRGRRPSQPPTGKISIIWIISHPEDITVDELESYDLVYCASEKLALLLSPIINKPVRVLRQFTDTSLFRINSDETDCDYGKRHGTIFIANARGVLRNMVIWADNNIEDFELYGKGWNQFGLRHRVKASHINNNRLPELYGRVEIGLNDHWEGMREFGIVNNRVLDYMASGLPVISDSFPEIRQLFKDVVVYADTEKEFIMAYEHIKKNYQDVSEKIREFWESEGHNYSVDIRARQIKTDIQDIASGTLMLDKNITMSGESVKRILSTMKENVTRHEKNNRNMEKYFMQKEGKKDKNYTLFNGMKSIFHSLIERIYRIKNTKNS
jgi:glycosyltransferase involved in cell wall biosynthesis